MFIIIFIISIVCINFIVIFSLKNRLENSARKKRNMIFEDFGKRIEKLNSKYDDMYRNYSKLLSCVGGADLKESDEEWFSQTFVIHLSTYLKGFRRVDEIEAISEATALEPSVEEP